MNIIGILAIVAIVYINVWAHKGIKVANGFLGVLVALPILWILTIGIFVL